MDKDHLVTVHDLSKKFCRTLKRSLWYGVKDIVGEVAGRGVSQPRLRSGEFWALENVSFALRRGECLGLIGRNGAGKSTLLKMLNGLIKPDRGRIELHGQVGALIELGAGFNPVLTGRENIAINGAVLGLSKSEISHRMDSIIAFADIGDFIDSPVRTYSSGMKVRLGFAVAANLDPDILLIDEVLAVGDAEFRAKCYNTLAERAGKRATIFVSHNMTHVARLATRTLVLEKGRELFFGATPEAVNAYYAAIESHHAAARHGSGEAIIESLFFMDAQGVATSRLRYGEPFRIHIEIQTIQPVGDVVIDVVFHGSEQLVAAECNNFVEPWRIRLESCARARVTASVDRLVLNPGVYRISALIMSADMTRHYDWLENVCTLEVDGGRPARGILQFTADWSLTEGEIDAGAGPSGENGDHSERAELSQLSNRPARRGRHDT